MKELWIERHAKETHGKYEQIMTKADAIAAIESWEAEMKRKFKVEQGREFNLTKDQKKVLLAILTSKDGVIIIQGDAGTGKTTLLQALKEITLDKGIKLRGLSTMGKAVIEIIEQGKIDESMTIDSHILRGKGIKDFTDSNGKVIDIVDESSMNATGKLYDVMDLGAKENARSILIGDIKQHPSIQSGGMFERAQKSKHVTFVEMKESIRQVDPFFKEVVKTISEGHISDGLNMLDNAKMIHEITAKNTEKEMEAPDAQTLKEKLYQEITNAYIESGNLNNLILAAQNKDRGELNKITRNKLKDMGIVGAEDFMMDIREGKNISDEDKKHIWNYEAGNIIVRGKHIYTVKSVDFENKMLQVVDNYSGKEITMSGNKLKDNQVYIETERKFSKGDKVIFLKNDYHIGITGIKNDKDEYGVQNGVSGFIQNIENLGNGNYKIDANIGERKTISFETKDYNYFTHGYAITSFKSQGQTVLKAFIYAAETTKNEIYVNLSRAKIVAEIWTLSKELLFKTAKNDSKQISSLDVEKRNWRPYTVLNLAEGYENIVSTISDIGEKFKEIRERFKRMNERESQKEKNAIKEKQDKPKEKIPSEKINKEPDKKSEKKIAKKH
jgi:ATP-dependent exoDNAse (exonuclease V) alpha subunit